MTRTPFAFVALALAGALGCGGSIASATDDAGPADVAPLDGASVEMFAQAQWAAKLTVHGEHLYWTTQLGSVVRAPRAGGAPTVIVSGPEKQAWGLAVDDANVYWATLGGRLWTAPIATGEARELAPNVKAVEYSLAVDAAGLYFLTRDGRVMRVARDGGRLDTLATGQSSPEQLALGGGHVYWTTATGIMVANTSGGDGRVFVPSAPYVNSLAVDAFGVYWVGQSDVSMASLAGDHVTAIASGLPIGQSGAYSVTADGGSVYWTLGSGTLYRASRAAGSSVPIAVGLDYPDGVVTDDRWVYWIEMGGGPRGDGSIVRRPK